MENAAKATDQAEAKPAEEVNEKAANMRLNGSEKVLVQFRDGDSDRVAHVIVTQQGTPHPKGLSAEIVGGHSDIDGATAQLIKDSAMNFVTGRASELKVSKYREPEAATPSTPPSEPVTPEIPGN